MIKNFDELLKTAKTVKGKKVVVIYPTNEETLSAVADGCNHGLAKFILVGDEGIIKNKMGGKTPSGVEIVHENSVGNAIQRSIELIREGKGNVILKGGVDTGTMMKALLQEEAGIRTGKLLSDVCLIEVRADKETKLIMVSDGGLTLAPDLKEKLELIKNAVDVAHAIGNENPKVAILSAIEFVNTSLQSTVDAAILAKMNDRGQIKGCIVDGPLAFDNAVSAEAAAEKGVKSPVAGKADILILPSIEAANIFVKGITYYSGFRRAHVIMGAKIPILIPSRADKSDTKLLSIALGVIMSGRKE
jgi:phosphate butyryltransferase